MSSCHFNAVVSVCECNFLFKMFCTAHAVAVGMSEICHAGVNLEHLRPVFLAIYSALTSVRSQRSTSASSCTSTNGNETRKDPRMFRQILPSHPGWSASPLVELSVVSLLSPSVACVCVCVFVSVTCVYPCTFFAFRAEGETTPKKCYSRPIINACSSATVI